MRTGDLSQYCLCRSILVPETGFPKWTRTTGVLHKLIGAVVLFAALAANAQVTSTRLVPRNVSIEKRFLFLIGATKTNDIVRFSVTVAPNAKTPSSPVEAYLMLFDGEGEITRQPLNNLHGQDQPYRYEFEVASRGLAHSQFVFRDMPKADIERSFAAGSFWFFLKDFITAAAFDKRAAGKGW